MNQVLKSSGFFLLGPRRRIGEITGDFQPCEYSVLSYPSSLPSFFFLPIYPNTDWFAIIGWPDKLNREETITFPPPARFSRYRNVIAYNIISLSKFARAIRELTYRVDRLDDGLFFSIRCFFAES